MHVYAYVCAHNLHAYVCVCSTSGTQPVNVYLYKIDYCIHIIYAPDIGI